MIPVRGNPPRPKNSGRVTLSDSDGYSFTKAVRFIAARRAGRRLRCAKPRGGLRIRICGNLADVAGYCGAANDIAAAKIANFTAGSFEVIRVGPLNNLDEEANRT